MLNAIKAVLRPYLLPLLNAGHRIAVDTMRRVRETSEDSLLAMARQQRRQNLAELASSRRPVALLLAPEAGLVPFYASHAILARTVDTAGHDALILSCNGLLPTCSVKMAMRLGATTSGDADNVACRRCRRLSLKHANSYQLRDVAIETLVDAEGRRKAAAIVAGSGSEPWTTTYDGINFGALALGEALRATRRTQACELTEADLVQLRGILHSSLLVYLAVSAAAARFNIASIAYFGDYAYWLAVNAYARRTGIRSIHVDHAYNLDTDRRFIGLRPDSSNVHTFDHQIGAWPQHRDTPIDPLTIERVTETSIFRLTGHGHTSILSPNWTHRGPGLQRELGLRDDRKTIVAFTSSADEIVAIQQIFAQFGKRYGREPTPFPEQNSWLRALAEWMAGRPDLQLVIRLHPRIGVSYRSSLASSEYHQLRADLTNVAPNVKVIWPEDKISSYDLAEVADAATVSWSIMGLELARFGVPVVAAYSGRGVYPTGTFVDFAQTPEVYLAALEQCTSRPASYKHILEAFRWTHYVHWSTVVDVSDLVPVFNYEDLPPWQPPKNRDTIARVVVDGADLSELNMSRLPVDDAARTMERAAMLAAIRRLISLFLVGRVDAHLDWQSLRIKDGDVVTFEVQGKQAERYSPLARRLVRLWLEQQDTAASAVCAEIA